MVAQRSCIMVRSRAIAQLGCSSLLLIAYRFPSTPHAESKLPLNSHPFDQPLSVRQGDHEISGEVSLRLTVSQILT